MNHNNDDPGGEKPDYSAFGNTVELHCIDNGRAPIISTEELEAIGRFVLDCESFEDTSASIVIADDSYVHGLNYQYRGKDESTDVLSFASDTYNDPVPMPEPWDRDQHAGDIIISPDAVARNASRFGVSEEEELRRVVVHGMLHICGRTHKTNNTDEPMLRLQEELLLRWSRERQR